MIAVRLAALERQEVLAGTRAAIPLAGGPVEMPGLRHPRPLRGAARRHCVGTRPFLLRRSVQPTDMSTFSAPGGVVVLLLP